MEPINKYIKIVNDGRNIKSTNFFDSKWAKDGNLFFSAHGKIVRILLPDEDENNTLKGLNTFFNLILSRGPSTDYDLTDAFELLVDDYSPCPQAIVSGTGVWDSLPSKGSVGNDWILEVWAREGRVFQEKMKYQLVDKISRRERGFMRDLYMMGL